MMIELESDRLHIREITADDLSNVLPVHLSNPDFLQYMEGSEGEAGRYDLERWQRDWYIAQLMPGRHMLACYLKDGGEAAVFSEYLEENEDDGKPWLGVLSIHKAYQRQGLGTEALQRLFEHFRQEYSWPLIRAGVLEQNGPGLAFAQHVGFKPIRKGLKQLAGGEQQFIVLERSL
ncbi:MAG TPA: GNAT family N-acetyltransferase [Ktedonobacteraceae bacterium]